MKTWIARIWHVVTDPEGAYVTPECLARHQYDEDTRGVDLPSWRTPAEVAQIRRQARRASWRVVGGRRQDERKTG